MLSILSTYVHACISRVCFCTYTHICCMYIALATGDPTGKIVYADINASQVVGWPQAVPFCHPNNLSKNELQKVSSAMKEIKFILGL